ncbi:EF-P lysine aminoacylase GenX [Reinekea forsetii]|nr:EF-P lysine aminoacylase GenX [Reinekea forsetii]
MNWQPSASLNALRHRAEVFSHIRSYFKDQKVLEVDTPALSRSTGTDVHLSQFITQEGYALHTSPEFPMKRLLAAGSGDIYQLAHVFRQDETGQRHNPEFMMLEWYRTGWDEWDLMSDVVNLINGLTPGTNLEVIHTSYEQAFLDAKLPNPFTSSLKELQFAAARLLQADADQWQRDDCLDALMALVVEPNLPKERLCFIHSYPQSQAALAAYGLFNDQAIARRFELYWQGMELANGYFELTDSVEQKRRFEAETVQRQQLGLAAPKIDEAFLAALEQGMPSCSGVALGVDRLLMILGQYSSISEVLPFEFGRA